MMPSSLPAAQAAALGRVPNRAAYTFRADSFAAALNGDKTGRFSMLPISGVPFRHPYWGNFVVDLATLKLKAQKIPALREHDSVRIVGWTDRIQVGDYKTGVQVEGTFSQATRDGKEVAALADEGFPWEASVYIPPSSVEFVAEGAEVEVNGTKLTGPGAIFRGAILEEVSFCAVGADPKARARALTGAPDDENQDAIFAFSAVGEAPVPTQQEAEMPDKKTDSPAPAAASAPAPTFSQADIDAAIKADREERAKLARRILDLCGPENEKLAQELIEKDSSLEAAKDEVIAHQRAKLAQKIETFHRDPGAGIQPREADPMKTSKAPEEPARVDERALILGRNEIDVDKAKAKFKASPELRKEFGGSEGAFIEYLKAESRGEVSTKPPRD